MTVAVAQEVIEQTEKGIHDAVPVVRYSAFTETGIHFSVSLRLKNVMDQYLIRHELLKKIHARYQAEGIVIPLSVTMVSVGEITPQDRRSSTR